MDVELRHLRYFVAVAEEASFTAAARRVHVAQQALSAQIRQLEDEIGVQLLERGSRGVSLTAAGAVFLDGAREALDGVTRTVGAARNTAGALTGRLSVGLHVSATCELTTAALSEFKRSCPDVEVSLRTFELTQPAGGLLDRSADVAFVSPPLDAPGLQLEVLTEDDRVFVLAADHPLAGRDTLTLADVAGWPWVAAQPSTDGCEPNSWRDERLINPRPGGDQPIIGAAASTITEWREHIVAGRGISLCPISVEMFYPRPGLAFVRSEGVPRATICVAWRGDDTSPVVRRFIEVVTEFVRSAAAH